jgi:squalene-hopene/tetraprenyl-beta-curcumene cyclase
MEEETMRRILLYVGSIVILGVAGLILWTAFRVRTPTTHSDGSYRSEWSPVSAASYLDYREAWWQSWPPAQLQHDTICISCHTVVPYAFARPELRGQLGETELTHTEKKILSSIETRVNDWSQMTPYYIDAVHAASSHSTEAVLNTVILAVYSTTNNQLDIVTRRAFDNAWALQETEGENAGAWKWQDFHEAPWESDESGYQGAAMMAIAVGMTSTQNSSDPTVRSHVERLRDYLLRNYDAQPVMSQLYVLWASEEIPGLLSDAQRKELLHKVASLQNSDGGWSLPSLNSRQNLRAEVLDLFKHADRVKDSDGCATGLAVLAIEKAGINSQDPVLQRGLAWLRKHQSQEGSWWAASLNGFSDPSSGVGRFMTDAATGYAVMALEGAKGHVAESDPAHNGDAARTGASAIFRQSALVPMCMSLLSKQQSLPRTRIFVTE